MRSWFDSPFVLTSAILLGLLAVAVSVVGYRRGERWSLLTAPLPPAGALLGIYAGDHDSRALGLAASALLLASIGLRQVMRRRRDVGPDGSAGGSASAGAGAGRI